MLVVIATTSVSKAQSDITIDQEEKIKLLQVYMIVSEGSNLVVTGELDQLTRNTLDNFAKRNNFYYEGYTLDDVINFIRFRSKHLIYEILQG